MEIATSIQSIASAPELEKPKRSEIKKTIKSRGQFIEHHSRRK